MSLNIKTTKKQTVVAPEGAYVARLYSIVDLGTQRIEWQGQTKNQPKVQVTFELCNETAEFDGVQKPLVVGGQYTMSLSDKSRFLPIIEGLYGRKLTDAEKADFDGTAFKSLLGKACMVSVMHTHKDDVVYANIASITPMPKGMEAPALVNPKTLYDVSEGESETFKSLPQFLQDKIKKSLEFTVDDENDIPFGSPDEQGEPSF